MQRGQFNQQQQNITIYGKTVVKAQYILGNEKYPDAGTNCNDAIVKF